MGYGGGYGGGKGSYQRYDGSYNTREYEQLCKCVEDTCKTLAPFEEQWDKDKFEKKLMQHLKKASDAAGPLEIRETFLKNMQGGWEQLTTDYVEKFYEQFWNNLGDRPWVDHHDFHLVIAAGIKFYCPPPGIAEVPDELFHQRINVAVACHFDKGRYYYWSREVIKRNLTDKRNFKIVRDAVDAARDAVVVVCPHTISDFLSTWIGQTIQEIAKDEKNPKAHLREADAVRLFTAMCEEGRAIPFLLTQIWGMPVDLEQQIGALFTLAFAPFPNVRMSKGEGKHNQGGDVGQQALSDMTRWFPGIGGSASGLAMFLGAPAPGRPGPY